MFEVADKKIVQLDKDSKYSSGNATQTKKRAQELSEILKGFIEELESMFLLSLFFFSLTLIIEHTKYFFFLASTRRQNDVVMTSIQRRFVVLVPGGGFIRLLDHRTYLLRIS